MDARKFSAKVAARRKANRMSQAELATAIGAAQSQVWSWENGTIPKAETIIRLARALGCSCDYLMRDEVGADAEPIAAIDELQRLVLDLAAEVGMRAAIKLLTLAAADEGHRTGQPWGGAVGGDGGRPGNGPAKDVKRKG